jgi:hypothetical protein
MTIQVKGHFNVPVSSHLYSAASNTVSFNVTVFKLTAVASETFNVFIQTSPNETFSFDVKSKFSINIQGNTDYPDW